ncbi:MAG: 3-dehydroquinate synthase [Acidovorax sp.]|uniref:3-dehydroquinate synthase n=1 Tax=Acidovorax sp. TaxID=1872122 RepID=UPI00391CADED
MADFHKYSSVEIFLGGRSYDIEVCDGFLKGLRGIVFKDGFRAVVVTNDVVAPIYLEFLISQLKLSFSNVDSILLPDGEIHKSWDSLNLIYEYLLENHCDRQTVLFALGGGVVGDITGFAAATYMRGIQFVQVPTTLLAQVDSSVGGKTAINHPLGKNMIGAFHQPIKVICDLSSLQTLPKRELSSGLAEVIKYGPILDMHFFRWLECEMGELVATDRTALAYAIHRCCEIKASIVSQDEKESGLRAILNFGHTFGHAIEAGMGYGVWLHGEGVAAGMVMAAELSRRLGMVDEAFVKRLTKLIERAGLPTKGPVLDAADNAGRYLELMRVDKKSEGGEIRFVLIDGPGKAVLRAAPDALVREVIDACCA